jgi:glycerate kinase
MADGGNGTLDVLIEANAESSKLVLVPVFDPLFRMV